MQKSHHLEELAIHLSESYDDKLNAVLAIASRKDKHLAKALYNNKRKSQAMLEVAGSPGPSAEPARLLIVSAQVTEMVLAYDLPNALNHVLQVTLPKTKEPVQAILAAQRQQGQTIEEMVAITRRGSN